MFTVADVIFPAFFYPYVAQLMYPLSALAMVSAEYLAYRLLNREQSGARLLALVLVANMVSSVVGIAIAAGLPSGLNSQFAKTGVGPARSVVWNRLAGLSWLVALAVSIAVEYPIVVAFTRARPFRRPILSVSTANVASYAALFAAFEVSVWLAWRC
jgi:hypothetical protein